MIIFTLYKDLYRINYFKLIKMFQTFIKVAKKTI
jgi:hypothetical protein